MPGKPKKTCFVISPIGSEGSETRQHADYVFKYVIEPATEKCGYDQPPVRADHDPRPSMITHSIVRYISTADLVIANISERNLNCFYELAIRHAVMKPCVHMIEEAWFPPPFDMVGMNMVRYNLSDWKSRDDAIENLTAAIQSAESDDAIVNPISMALATEASIVSGDATNNYQAILGAQAEQVINEMRELISAARQVIVSPRNLALSQYGISAPSGGWSGPAPTLSGQNHSHTDLGSAGISYGHSGSSGISGIVTVPAKPGVGLAGSGDKDSPA